MTPGAAGPPGPAPAAGAFVGCAGWRSRGPASEARAQGERAPMLTPPFAPAVEGDDDLSWHAMGPLEPEQGRRRRRIDAWRDGDLLVVDAFFRDVNVQLDGSQVVVHEYLVHADIDAASGRIEAITADPRVLPFDECPFASLHIDQLVGTSIVAAALDIHSLVRGETSCTHLNDMVRFLADVPDLAQRLLPVPG
jgi:hypothetical protein